MVYYCQSNLVGWKNSKQEELEANKNALAWFKKAGNEMREGEVCTYLGYNYSNKGDYENAFDYFSRALEIGKKLNKNADPDDFSNTLVDVGFMNIASMYSAGGDYQTALDYLHEYQQLRFHRNLSDGSGLQIEMTDNFLLARQYDSAFHYLTELRNVKMSAPVFLWPRIGDAFLLQGNKDSALFYFNKAIDSLRKEGQFWPVVQSALMRSYLGKAKILAAKNDPRQALDLVKRSNFFAEQRENKLAILNSYELQAQLFHQLRKNDSAYFYLRKFITIKDSMLTKQFLWRLNTNKKEAEEEKKTS
jgi:tetratricopeptide (TPR) repeat protein